MRRLAVQKRDDGYSSNKDYQQFHSKVSQRIVPGEKENRIVFTTELQKLDVSSDFVGFGGFILAEDPIVLKLTIQIDSYEDSKEFQIGTIWNRIGIAIPATKDERATLIMEWENVTSINVWGFDLGYLNLPESIRNKKPDIDVLNESHLCPETFYLPNQNAIDLDIEESSSTHFSIVNGSEIILKKCSYCQRMLPVNPELLGSLSFHKHNAKLTKHQNECRSCKKWRINNSFNPLRTTDQLHESSVITRERKILLKEPKILQEIKDRTGAGLKSQIWKKFGRKCFFCNEPIELDGFQLDHTRPLSYLWPIDEHATCLCPEHNNQKKDKFPIEFYTEDQLKSLSEITGLSYEELTIKDVNQKELDRIISNISTFAKEWDPRTFAAIARKIKELRKNTDLFIILNEADEETYTELVQQLEDRPDPVVNE